MTNADFTRPPGRVPDAPVVDISIVGDQVSVDGVDVPHDGSRPLHHVAVHAAAERVARPLGRPVRAIATDSEGRATLLVHPDGRATDVELIETFAAPEEVLADPADPTVAMPVPVPPVSMPAGPPPPPAVVPAAPLPAPAAMRSAAPAPVAAGSSGWPSTVVRSVAVAAALVAVVGMGVLLLTQNDDDPAAGTSTVETATDPEPTPVAAAAPVETPSASPTLPPADATGPTLTVTPKAGTQALQLTLDLEGASSSEPLTAEITLLPAGATEELRRTVTLDEASTDVILGKGRLPGGPATWQVSVAGLPVQEGSVTILGPYVPPAPTPSEVPVAPVAPVAPAPVAPPVTVTATPKPPKAAPQPKPQPKATRKPQPKPKPKPPAKKKPSKSVLKQ